MNIIINCETKDLKLIALLLNSLVETKEEPVKRKRGRPRTRPIPDPTLPKKKVGRPSLNGL